MVQNRAIVTMAGQEKVYGPSNHRPIDALDVLCAQLTRDLFANAIAKFL